MKNFIVVVTLLLFAAPVTAATYKWVDDRGTVNFSEDYGRIPKKFRKKARVVGEDSSSPPMAPEAKEESKARQKATGAAEAGKDAAADKPAKKKVVYGGMDEETWKKDYGKIRTDLKNAEEQLVETRGRLDDTSKMTRNEYLSVQNTIKALENRVLELRKRMDSLNDSAAKSGVPAGLLQ